MNFRLALHITGAFLIATLISCKKEMISPATLIYGHAGTTLYPERWVYPANTKESVVYALDVLNADGVEVDVQMTRDSILVLYHDPYLDDNTKLNGCVSDYNFDELIDLKLYQTKYELTTLGEIITICSERNKNLFLDVKPYNFCDSITIDYNQFNNALNKLLVPLSVSQRQRIVVNCRNAELLTSVSDSVLCKSFETENSSKAIEMFQAGEINEICLNISAMSDLVKNDLVNAGINFSIFGVKTQAEIEQALSYIPFRIITDNIAYTRKKAK